MRKDNSFTIRVTTEDLARWKAFAEHFKYKSLTALITMSVDRFMVTGAKKQKEPK